VNLKIDRALKRAQNLAHRHRRGIAAAAVVLLSGFAITAVAIAPLVPDPATLQQRLITETLRPQNMSSQLDALAAHELALTRSDITRATDTARSLLARLGVNDASAAAFLGADSTARLVLNGRGGKMVQARTDANGNLIDLVARFPTENTDQAQTHFTRLTLSRIYGRWLAQLQTAPLSAQTRLASGTVDTTLFAATDDAHLPDAVAAQLADTFATQIDFHRELRRGDTFSVVYESLTADGEPVAWNDGAGRLLAAEFVNGGKAHHAVWFAHAEGRGAYFGLDGSSLKRSFLASPMAFSRVTSGFAMRFHPTQQSWRQHLGVDYAAPVGTAVRSVGDGMVDFAGIQGGYGKVVQVQHSNNRSTLYAHLSRIDVKKGQRIEQGQLIGAVGTTGWTTGPHLHFEFRLAGEHQDPVRIAKASEPLQLDTASRARFAELVRAVQVKLDLAETIAGARGLAE
jgi:murein DD-endopeptidase MepM/ murein hydrolase activator NlpD